MVDYHGNTRREKDEQKKEKNIEKVVTGEVVRKPKGIARKFKGVFFGGDFKTAMRFVVAEVLYPAARDLIFDSVIEGTRRVVYPESQNYRRRPVEYRPRIQYNNPQQYNNPIYRQDPRGHVPDQAPHIYPQQYRPNKQDLSNDIILGTREEAELVVERLIDIVDKYDVASLADLYDLLGLSSSHVDNKWGWSYLNNIEIRQVRNGYLIDLPPLEEI